MATVEQDPLAERREELQRLRDERDNLAREWSDRRFDEITRSRFNELEGEIREAEEFVKEKEKINRLLERSAAEGVGLEEGASFHTARPAAVRGDDIWDLSTVERSWDNPAREAEQLHDRALRAIERSRFPHPRANPEHMQGHLERLLGDENDDRKGRHVSEYLLATGSPEYKRAFTRAISGQPLSERENSLLYRAMSLTAASGGYAVPFVLDPTLLPTSSGAVNPYRAISNVSQITVDEWRGVTSGGVTASFQAEAAEVTDASPTLAQPTVSTEMGRAFIPFSIEVGMDWSGFAADMARDIQDGKDTVEATKFAVGSGTNEPFGVVTGASTVYTASNTNSLVIADIYGVHDALGPRFRGSGAAWVMNNLVLSRIRQLDTAGGSAMLTSSLQQRSAANSDSMTDARANVDIFGRPVYEASGQSGTFTTGQIIAVFGNFQYFKIVDRIGLTIETIPHLFATANNLPSGQRGLFAYWRTGSKVLSAAAFRALKLA